MPESNNLSNETLEQAVGIVVDHIMTTKKVMESGGKAYQSIVPLKGGDKPMPDDFVARLYDVLQKEEKPYLEQDFPYYYKTESGELTEGVQTDRRYRTRIDHVNVMELWDKGGSSVLESHVVVGPIKE